MYARAHTQIPTALTHTDTNSTHTHRYQQHSHTQIPTALTHTDTNSTHTHRYQQHSHTQIPTALCVHTHRYQVHHVLLYGSLCERPISLCTYAKAHTQIPRGLRVHTHRHQEHFVLQHICNTFHVCPTMPLHSCGPLTHPYVASPPPPHPPPTQPSWYHAS